MERDDNAVNCAEQRNRAAAAPLQLSTNDFRRASAWSHWAETESRYLRRSWIGRGSSSKRRSRPARTWRTSPAPSSTRRCFVIAWRVRREPEVSSEIEQPCPALSLATSDNRV